MSRPGKNINPTPFLIPNSQRESNIGQLLAVDFTPLAGWVAGRVFEISGVPAGTRRGDHAHFSCDQLLTCTAGEIEVVVDDGLNSWEFILTQKTGSLFVPAGLWAAQTYKLPNSRLLVSASHAFDEQDYIRSRSAFLEFRGFA